MIFGLVQLLGYWLAGEALVQWMHWPLPGAVLGMLLLLCVSLLRRRMNPQLAETGSGLLSHLALLFVPAGVGLIEHGPLLRQQGWAILLVIVLSTLITMAATALILQYLLRRRQGG